MRKLIIGLTALACVGAISVFAQEGPIKIKEIFRSAKNAAGQEIKYPNGNVEIVAATADFQPGIATPVHKHPYPRSIYVLEGTFTVTEEGGQPHTYPAGSLVVESVDTWHTGSNMGAGPLKLLVIDNVPIGVNNTVPKPK